MYNYPLAIELGDDKRSFGVTVPDIPGCFSAGETLDEAIENAHEAIAFHLEGLADQGELPPAPNGIEQHRDNFDGYTWGIARIDPTPYLGKSEKLNVTLPSHVTSKIDAYIGRSGGKYKNRSHFLQLAALAELNEKDRA